MPVHDWTRVDDGTFHDFHVGWTVAIRSALNGGILPAGYYAQAEQVAGNIGPDVLTLQAEINEYTLRQRSVIIRHARNHRIVALIEILSPGNKGSEYAFSQLLAKIGGALYRGIHLLVIDLLPPTPRDPYGIHAAIWEAIRAGTFIPPEGRPLTLVSYDAGPHKTAYVEPLAVGQMLPSMSLFLEAGYYVAVPLEATYQTAWEGTPALFRDVLTGEAPAP
jgi:hypothetical protein